MVDDASTDGTVAVVEGYPDVKLIRHEDNLRQAAARNTAIAAASGEFVAALDQDDRNLPGRLRRQLETLHSTPGCEAVIGTARHVHLDGELAPDHGSGWALEEGGELAGLATEEAAGKPITSTLLFRRSAVAGEDAYDTTIDFADDLDLGLRFIERGQLAIVSDELIERLIHSGNQSRDHAAVMRSYTLAMKRRIDRKRAAAAGRSGS